MNDRQRFTIACAQIGILFFAMTAVTGLALAKALPGGAVETLLGAIFAHAGITAYNGATKATAPSDETERRTTIGPAAPVPPSPETPDGGNGA